MLDIIISDAKEFIIPFLFINELVWLSGLWITTKIYRRLCWKQQAYSYFYGWLQVSVVGFLLSSVFSTFNVMSPNLIFGIFVIFFVINIFNLLSLGNRSTFAVLFTWEVLISKVSFVALFVFMYLVLSFGPQINQIERFMDYGFVATLLNSTSLPLEDVWFSGLSTNYYYFGHFIVYVMVVLTGIPLEQVFFLAVCFIFAYLSLGAFSIGYILTDNILKRSGLIGGLLSAVVLVFSGPLHTVNWLVDYVKFKNFGAEEPFFWYAAATRLIKGTISEFPFFSFLEANIHAHVWGLVIAVTIISVLILFHTDNKFEDSFFSLSNYRFYAIAFLLGVAFVTNSWDVLTLGSLSIALLVRSFLKDIRSAKPINALAMFTTGLVIFLCVTVPWYMYFSPPVGGVGIVSQRSDVSNWLMLWGIFVILVLLYVSTLYFYDKKRFYYHLPIISIIGISVLFLLLAEIFFVKDILIVNEWFRANTYFKISSQIWVWLSLISGPVILYSLFITKFRILIIVFSTLLFIGLLYPIQTIKYFTKVKTFDGISNPISFLYLNSPYDYDAYIFLKRYKDNLPLRERKKTIIEASGDSYKDNNYFSVLLGWPSVVGWPVHEWTWRGSYDEVGKRREEVGEVYQGDSFEKAREIIDKYKVDFVIVGEAEKRIYGDFLKSEKIRFLGTVIYENSGTFVIKINR